jgi:hypothetical protein
MHMHMTVRFRVEAGMGRADIADKLAVVRASVNRDPT